MDNYHSHTTISDGKNSPEEMIREAIKKGIRTLAITDHYKGPKGFRKWMEKRYSKKDYELLRKLQKKYRKKIRLLVGVELDWLKDYKEWLIIESNRRPYDYRIISVHYIKIGGEYHPIDNTEESFKKMIRLSGGIRKLVGKYYKELRKAINLGLFNTVAHFDLIKIYNYRENYFSEKEKWYHEEIKKTLRCVAKQKNMNIEINTAGWRKKVKKQYPSEWIIREAKKLGIPLVTSADSHNKEQIIYKLKEAKKLL